MKLSGKVVTKIPLETLWTNELEIPAKRKSYLTKNDIKQLLKQSKLQFVIADGGYKLNWIEINKCFDFWKSEVEKHLATDINKIYLDNFPDNYAYIASEWIGEIETPIVLLEKVH
jgi:hypothetical protein